MWLLCVQPFGSLSGCSRSRQHKEEEVQCSFQAKFRWNHMFIHGENIVSSKNASHASGFASITSRPAVAAYSERTRKLCLMNDDFIVSFFIVYFSLPWKINVGNNIFSNLSKEWNMPFSKEWDARSNLIAILKPLRSDHCPVQRLQTAAWQFWSIPWQKSCHLSRWQCISQMLERSVRTYTHPSHVRWPDMVSSIEPLSHRKREDGNSWLASDSWNECSNGRAWGAHPRYQTMFYGVWECHALGVHWSRAASGISVF